MTGVYKITNLINNKVYVGKSTNVTKRFSKHRLYLNKNIHINAHLQSAWNMYGEDNFKFDILEICSLKMLNKREIYWINILNSIDCGYNMKFGGDGGALTGDALLRMKKSLTGRKHSINTIKKMQKSHLGHKVSQKVRKAISIAQSGKPKSIEHRKKLSEALKGKKYK